MGLEGLKTVVVILGFAAEIALLCTILIQQQYKSFPIFTLYIAGNLLTDIVIFGSLAAFSAHVGGAVYLATLPFQNLLELAVLFEIGWKVLRPVQPSLPKGLVRAFVVLVSIAMLCGVLLAWQAPANGTLVDELVNRLNLTVGLLRLLIFAAIAGFAQLLGIGFKNRVLQIATAISFYSALDLMVTLAERHMDGSTTLEPVRSLCYLLELSFLVWAFTTKEVRRAEFSPQMEQFLVILARRAKSARTTFARMQVK